MGVANAVFEITNAADPLQVAWLLDHRMLDDELKKAVRVQTIASTEA